jgi:hypothetical protein
MGWTVPPLYQVSALLYQWGLSHTLQPTDGHDRRLPTLHHGRRKA